MSTTYDRELELSTGRGAGHRFLVNACLLGGAILIWATLIGSAVGGYWLAANYGNDSPPPAASVTTDSYGVTCQVAQLAASGDETFCTKP